MKARKTDRRDTVLRQIRRAIHALSSIERAVTLDPPISAQKTRRPQTDRASKPITTREDALKVTARLICINRATLLGLDSIAIAARLVMLPDLNRFADEIEEYVRGILRAFENYIESNPQALKRCDRMALHTFQCDMKQLRMHLGRIPKIADGNVDLDIGDEYLPPEFRREELED